MKEVGYGDRRHAKKCMKDIFYAAVAHAKMKGVDLKALSWEGKFSRLKSNYSKSMARKSKSGASESRRWRGSRHFLEHVPTGMQQRSAWPPCVIDFGQDVMQVDNEEKEQTSSRKRARTAELQVLEEFADAQKEIFEREITVLEKGNDTRQKLPDARIAYLQRHWSIQ